MLNGNPVLLDKWCQSQMDHLRLRPWCFRNRPRPRRRRCSPRHPSSLRTVICNGVIRGQKKVFQIFRADIEPYLTMTCTVVFGLVHRGFDEYFPGCCYHSILLYILHWDFLFSNIYTNLYERG